MDKKVVDFETFKILKDTEKALDGFESMMQDVYGWPEEEQLQFAKEAMEILEPLLATLKKVNSNE